MNAASPVRRRGACRDLACVIVEDQTMFRQLLVGMLRTMPGIDVRATAATMQDGIDACASSRCDLLILDLLLPDGDGLSVLRAATETHPAIECIVLSSAASEFACPRDLLDNVRAIVDKAQAYEQLQTIIAEIVQARGGPGSTAARPSIDPARVLRPRELDVLRLIGRGLKTADIATHLGISAHTVSTHRKRIATKLGASGAELVRLATIHNQLSGGGQWAVRDI